MSDLVAFLSARLDDDEATAKAASSNGTRWRTSGYDRDDERVIKSVDGPYQMTIYDEGGHDAYQAAHIVRHDPARVLREVEARRKILADYERIRRERKAHPGDLALAGALLTLGGVLRNLAAVWSDHPDYDPAWA